MSCAGCGNSTCEDCNPRIVNRGDQGPAGPQGPTGPTGPTGPATDITGTSTTSLAIGTGSKTFTTQAGIAFEQGQFVSAVSTASPTNWMIGTVTSYSGTTLVLSITGINGSGTIANWNLSLSGPQGPRGYSINWLGDLAAAPATPALNDGYHNTTTRISYVWDGSAWQTICVDGTNGSNGSNGTNGISIVWKGSLPAPPGAPQLNWAYYDTVLLRSRIWDGAAWQILAIDGTNGTNGTDGFNYETVDGNGIPAEATGPYQFLMRNSSDGGYTFVSLGTLKELLNAIP